MFSKKGGILKNSRKFAHILALGLFIGATGGAIAAESGAKSYYEGASGVKEGKIRIGRISILTGLALNEEYDDNIYLANGDNDTTERIQSDWRTHLRPSLSARYDMMERGVLSLGYTGNFAYYSTNTDNNWSSHKIAFKGDYKAPVGLIVGIGNDYTNTEDPYSSANLYRLGQKAKRWNDNLQTKVGYEFAEKYRILAFYNFSKQQYDQEQDFSQNYETSEVGAGAEARITPMTWAFLRYYTGETKYTSHPAGIANYSDATDAGYQWNRVNSGLSWDATSKLSGELNLGYQWITPNNETDPNGNPYQDRNSWITSTRVAYQATPRTRIGADLYRATVYSGGNVSQNYEQTGFNLSLNQGVMTKCKLRAGAGYEVNDYSQPDFRSREDKLYRANIGFDYAVTEWLTAGLGYRYWQRDSSVRSYDFTDNRFLLTVGLEY